MGVGPSRAALRACAILLLLAPSPALAATGTFTLERIGPYEVLASPGEARTLPAELANQGPGAGAFPLQALRGHGTAGWEVFSAAERHLGPGEKATVDAVALAPTSGGVSFVSLRACDDPHASTCREVSWRVSTPLVVRLHMKPTYGPAEQVAGTVEVTWLNGAPLRNLAVKVSQQTTPVTVATTETFTTDGEGRASFSLLHPAARSPGRHLVFVEAAAENVPVARASGQYAIALG